MSSTAGRQGQTSPGWTLSGGDDDTPRCGHSIGQGLFVRVCCGERESGQGLLWRERERSGFVVERERAVRVWCGERERQRAGFVV